ncbi:hypothetical protein TNCV_3186531 [Trichonephila clavipes]|nr:hypothetical protein TNCV_3186531 [Trichonephila clavipes]
MIYSRGDQPELAPNSVKFHIAPTKFEEVVSAQVSYSSFDHGSNLRSPSPKALVQLYYATQIKLFLEPRLRRLSPDIGEMWVSESEFQLRFRPHYLIMICSCGLSQELLELLRR